MSFTSFIKEFDGNGNINWLLNISGMELWRLSIIQQVIKLFYISNQLVGAQRIYIGLKDIFTIISEL